MKKFSILMTALCALMTASCTNDYEEVVSDSNVSNVTAHNMGEKHLVILGNQVELTATTDGYFLREKQVDYSVVEYRLEDTTYYELLRIMQMPIDKFYHVATIQYCNDCKDWSIID